MRTPSTIPVRVLRCGFLLLAWAPVWWCSGSSAARAEESRVVHITPGAPTEGPSASGFTAQAWKALEAEQYEKAVQIADDCAERFSARAIRLEGALADFAPPEKAFRYSVLNDVATCLFIKARSLQALQQKARAREVYQQIREDFAHAQCWDPKGWFWKVAEAAQDELDAMDLGIDYGDYSSAVLTLNAWRALDKRSYRAAEMYTDKCVQLYAVVARDMQSSLDQFPVPGQESDFWALNDVATCLFIKGKSLQRRNRKKEAAQLFREILRDYPSAQCWDPHGFYWKVADEARRNLVLVTH